MTDDQLKEVMRLWESGKFYTAGLQALDLVRAIQESRDRAAMTERHLQETCNAFRGSILEVYAWPGESYVQAIPRVEEALRAAENQAATLSAHLKAANIERVEITRERNEAQAALAKQKEESGYPRLTEMFHQQEAELKAANETIAMLYERSGRFAAQADKYEQELKVAKAAILQVQSRLDDALALLSAKSAQLEAVLAKRLELGGALEAADQKIDELQERSAWFEAERHKDQVRLKSAEDEIKAAKEEKAEAIRLGDERLAELWDMKQKEIQSLKTEITRLRRHLGEIP